MEYVALLVGLICVAIARIYVMRAIVRAWRGGRLSTNGVALPYAVVLPTVVVVWSGAQGRLHPVILLVALVLLLVGFFWTRFMLGWLGDTPI